MSKSPLEIRRLTYADLPQVIAIERRAFPTPWSLAMFVLELSKPSGVCLAALRDGRLVAYCVCSRYDTVWHLMNIAVDPDKQRQGIATALLAALNERVNDDQARFTLEVRRSNAPAISLYERHGYRAAGRQDRRASVVAARLEREDGQAVRMRWAFGTSASDPDPLRVAGVDHMIRASSPLSW